MKKIGENVTEQRTNRGRPRRFNQQKALQSALDVFMKKGYEGASLEDLTTAMQINRPSLYAAFGNKEQLFLKTLEVYADPAYEHLKTLLFSQQKTVQEAFEDAFFWFTSNHTAQHRMQGCLMVNSTVLCGENTPTALQLNSLNQRNEQLFKLRLQKGLDDKQLSKGTNIEELSQYFSGLMQGIAVMARQRNDRSLLENITKTGLKIFRDPDLQPR